MLPVKGGDILITFVAKTEESLYRVPIIEEPRSKLRGMFCLAAVLRSDSKELRLILIRSLTPQQSMGNVLAARFKSNKASVLTPQEAFHLLKPFPER